jgi:serine/threonine protein phosphatase 1
MSLLNLFKRRSPVETRAVAAKIPADERVYAIGDIHGRDDLFAALLDQIAADDAARPAAKTTLILLGDLVDRGPDSASVVERARRLAAPFDKVRLLVGNHEECFLAALTGDVRRLRYFVRIGGDATIRSYWCDDKAYDAASFEELAERIGSLVPQSHVDFLNGGEDIVEIGDYVFVHAGLRYGVPLNRQTTTDLRWIRDDFLGEARDFGAMVIYGHTISEEVDEQPNRIGIDTGAYASNRLTAIGLQGSDRWYLST